MTSNYQPALPEVQIRTQQAVQDIKVLRLKGEDWLIVSDISGFLTFVKVDPGNQAQATIGAFNDTKGGSPNISKIFLADEGTLYAIGETGLARRWNFI